MEFLVAETATRLIEIESPLVEPVYGIYYQARSKSHGVFARRIHAVAFDTSVSACILWELFAVYGAVLIAGMGAAIKEAVDGPEEGEEWTLAEQWGFGTIDAGAEWFARNTPLARTSKQLHSDVLRYMGPKKWLDAVMRETPVKLAEGFDPDFLSVTKGFSEFAKDLMLYLTTGQTVFQKETGWCDELLSDCISFEDVEGQEEQA